MWPDANEARHPALEHPTESLCPHRIRYSLYESGIIALTHDFGFDDVDGRTDGGSDKSCKERCREMRSEVILQRSILEQDALESIVRGKLADSHEHGSR